MKRAVIKDWSIVGSKGDLFIAPELQIKCLIGNVYGHPDHKDGTYIRTSSINYVDGTSVFTNNTHYTLDRASDSYREWYLNQYGETLNEANPFREESDEV